jgi:hypothetical protein
MALSRKTSCRGQTHAIENVAVLAPLAQKFSVRSPLDLPESCEKLFLLNQKSRHANPLHICSAKSLRVFCHERFLMNPATKTPRPEPISPFWVIATLKGRGIPVPSVAAAKHSLAELDAQASIAFRERIQRLAKATEIDDELSTMAEWKVQAELAFAVKPAPVITRTVAPKPQAANESCGAHPDFGQPATVVKRPALEQVYEPTLHVYASKAALCMELTEVVRENQDRAGEGAFWTVQIEMAHAINRQRFDWDGKIIFRLTKRELPLVAAVLLGWMPEVTFANHGAGNDKALHIEDQGSNLFFRLHQGKKVIPLPVGGEELFALAAMVLKALCLNAPHLDSQTVLQIVKRAGGLYSQSVGLKAA